MEFQKNLALLSEQSYNLVECVNLIQGFLDGFFFLIFFVGGLRVIEGRGAVIGGGGGGGGRV